MQKPAVCSLRVQINGVTVEELNLTTSGSDQTVAVANVAELHGQVSLTYKIAFGLDAQRTVEESISVPEGKLCV